jgi:hypothetical protein
MNPSPKKPLLTRMAESNFFGISSFFGLIVGLILGFCLMNVWPDHNAGGHPPSLIPPGLFGGLFIGCSLGAILGLIGLCLPEERPWVLALTFAIINDIIAVIAASAVFE